MYIEFSHVTTHCKGFSLKDISFLVPEGFITGLVGENGAGKSTTVNSILGLIKKDSGKIMISSHDTDNFDYAVKEKYFLGSVL